MNHLVVYASGKGTDERRAQIDSIIYRLSCQSTYFKEQQRKDAATDARIAKMKETVSKSPPLPQSSRLEIDELVTKYRSTRRKRSSHVVVDMDAFYFSCHLADQKERGNTDCLIEYPKGSGKMRKLVDVPAAVGGGGERISFVSEVKLDLCSKAALTHCHTVRFIHCVDSCRSHFY